MENNNKKADVCLILEGTYPYVSGGVSTWTHDLIRHQPHLDFALLTLSAPKADLTHKFDLPENVISIDNVCLQELHKGDVSMPKDRSKKFFSALERALLNMQVKPNLSQLETVLDILQTQPGMLGSALLLNSHDAWKMILRMYHSTLGNASFLDYFWSWRALLGGMYSVLLGPLPEATTYHALCTGYAGLYLARAKVEKNRHCMLTEHGIYTNERRIELISANWLDDPMAQNFNVDLSHMGQTLRDFWMQTFIGYSKLCYDSCDQIITLYEGNCDLQIADGAQVEKLNVVPNGIDFERFNKVQNKTETHVPTIALIGRLVPIKDIKTYIRACHLVKMKIPNLKAYMIGPDDEDKAYASECLELHESLGLQETLTFTGKVDIDGYLGEIDLIVLTSISEAQPLVILEAGAAGIVSVATDVGACREMIEGRSDESPKLGLGGRVCPLYDPDAIADAIYHLLSDHELRQQCAQVIKSRVKTYYHQSTQHKAYRELYQQGEEEIWLA